MKDDMPHLSQFIRSKLGISLKDFAELEGVSVSTLQDRWKSPRQQRSVRDSVFRRYVMRYEEL